MAEGRIVCVPIRAPEASVTVGGPATLFDVGADSATDANRIAATLDLMVKDIVKELSDAPKNEEVDEL